MHRPLPPTNDPTPLPPTPPRPGGRDRFAPPRLGASADEFSLIRELQPHMHRTRAARPANAAFLPARKEPARPSSAALAIRMPEAGVPGAEAPDTVVRWVTV